MIVRRFTQGFSCCSALFLCMITSPAVAFPGNCEGLYGVDRVVCEATMEHVLVTGTRIPSPAPSPIYAPGVTATPSFPQVPVGVPRSNGNDNTNAAEKKREKCVANVEALGKHCKSTYNSTWRTMCMFTGAIVGRFGYLRVPMFARYSYGVGAGGVVGFGCSRMTDTAKQWCQQQVDKKIESKCN